MRTASVLSNISSDKFTKLCGLLLLLSQFQPETKLYAQNSAESSNGSRIASGRPTQQSLNSTVFAPRQRDIEVLYQQGILAAQKGDLLKAVVTFEKVSWLNYEYKDIKNKLADAQFNLNKQLLVAPQPGLGMNFLLIIGLGFLFSFMSVISLFLFSSNVRGRYYLMQGEFGKATVIFENILSKHPEKFNIYQILANIYLINNRRDEQALEIFKMVLQLNLFPERENEINSILAKQYLTEGRSDMAAIEVMEKELNARMMKMKNG